VVAVVYVVVLAAAFGVVVGHPHHLMHFPVVCTWRSDPPEATEKLWDIMLAKIHIHVPSQYLPRSL